DFDEWDAKGLAVEMARSAYPSAEIGLESDRDADWLWTITVDGATRGGVRRARLGRARVRRRTDAAHRSVRLRRAARSVSVRLDPGRVETAARAVPAA